MLQNPMIMMMGAVGVMVLALPYMMVRSPLAFWKNSTTDDQLGLSDRKTWIQNS